MKKIEMIESICKRYYALNAKDYEDGLIDADVRKQCDGAVEGFKQALNNLSEEDIITLFRLDRNAQVKVFSWDSGCDFAQNCGNKEWVKDMLSKIKKDMEDTGLGRIPCINKVLAKRIQWLEWMVSGEWKDLGEGVVAIDFNQTK